MGSLIVVALNTLLLPLDRYDLAEELLVVRSTGITNESCVGRGPDVRPVAAETSERLLPLRVTQLPTPTAFPSERSSRAVNGAARGHDCIIGDEQPVAVGVGAGPDKLQGLLAVVSREGAGVVVKGEVGITSHVGDILRKARVLSRLGHTAAA